MTGVRWGEGWGEDVCTDVLSTLIMDSSVNTCSPLSMLLNIIVLITSVTAVNLTQNTPPLLQPPHPPSSSLSLSCFLHLRYVCVSSRAAFHLITLQPHTHTHTLICVSTITLRQTPLFPFQCKQSFYSSCRFCL